MPYARFGADFRRLAVTVDRVTSALSSLARRELRFGPYSAIPLTSIEAGGRLGTPRVRLADPQLPSFDVTVPATLDLAVKIGAVSRVQAELEIDLLLTPRPADGLFLYIDAAPVRASDVRIQVRGRGLGVAVSGVVGGLPGAVSDEVRRQVAKQITNALRGSASRRARTIDIAARVDGSPKRPAPPALRWVDDAGFARQFVRRAVSVERVTNGFGSLAGRTLEIGPLKVGPGGMATVRATGTVDRPAVTPPADDSAEPTFTVLLPLHLELGVELLGRIHRYRAEITTVLRATPKPADRVRIVIDIPPVETADITVALEAADNLAGMLGRAGKIEDQIAAQVRRTVNEQIAAADARVVDVGAIVSGAARQDEPPPRPRPQPS